MTEASRVLTCPMQPNDAGAATVGDYLRVLLVTVWTRGADFSGKRPFGSSSWRFDIYEALVRAGIVSGTFDEDGYLEEFDTSAGHALVLTAIRELTWET